MIDLVILYKIVKCNELGIMNKHALYPINSSLGSINQQNIPKDAA